MSDEESEELDKNGAISYTSAFCCLFCIDATMSDVEFPWRFIPNVDSGFGFLHLVAVGCVTDLLLLSFSSKRTMTECF